MRIFCLSIFNKQIVIVPILSALSLSKKNRLKPSNRQRSERTVLRLFGGWKLSSKTAYVYIHKAADFIWRGIAYFIMNLTA